MSTTAPAMIAATPLVGILTGSPNDLPTVVKIRETLTVLGIPSEIIVASAHRTPDKVLAYLERAHREGVQVLVGCAGVAAHLAGVIAGHTLLPVIGVPLGNGPLTGLDSLFAAVYSVESLNFPPNPMLAAYRSLLRVERLSPRRCIMVEDSLANLVTAKTLGMKTVWVSTGLRDSPSVDVKVRSVRELPRHLNRL